MAALILDTLIEPFTVIFYDSTGHFERDSSNFLDRLLWPSITTAVDVWFATCPCGHRLRRSPATARNSSTEVPIIQGVCHRLCLFRGEGVPPRGCNLVFNVRLSRGIRPFCRSARFTVGRLHWLWDQFRGRRPTIKRANQ